MAGKTRDGLKKSLGIPSLLFYGIGVIIGAGIYSIIGVAAGQAGNALWLSLVIASIPAFLAALCYAELSTRFPRAGASYVYVREALPGRRWPPFMIGFIVACTAGATAATVSVAFSGYLAMFLPLPAWLSALLLLAGCTAVNVIGVRESAWVTAVATSIEVVGLLLIIGAGLWCGKFADEAIQLRAGATATDIASVFSAAALCFFVFTGFEGLGNLAEEARNPTRNLPIALMVSLAVTTVLYVLVALAVVALVEPRQLAASDSPLAAAAGAVHPRLATTLGWIALFSTANTALITLVVGSRLLYGMAAEGDMPNVVGRTLPRRRTPWVAALIILALSAAMLPLGGVALVGSIASLLTLIDFLAVAAALLIIRRRVAGRTRENTADIFRVPLSIAGVPVVPVVLVVCIVLLATQFPWQAYAVAASALLAGALLSLARTWWGQPRIAHYHSQEK